jgi:hypothetical protein
MDKVLSEPEISDKEKNAGRIMRLYRLDVSMLAILAAASWLAVLYTGYRMMALAPTAELKGFIAVLGFLLLAALSISMYMVRAHLRRNRREIYSEELYWREHNGKAASAAKE